MSADDEAFQLLCATLREEAGEQVERIGAVLLEVERGADGTRGRALLEEAFRQAHNLKGAAGSLGFTLTARLAHALETALGEIRGLPPSRARTLFDLLHQGLTLVPKTLDADPAADAPLEITRVINQLVTTSESLRPARPSAVPTVPKPPPIEPRSPPTPPVKSDPTPAPRTPPSHAPMAHEPTAAQIPFEQVVPPPPRPEELGTDPGEADALPEAGTILTNRAKLGAPATGALKPAEESLRVSTKKLSALMAQVGELLAARLRTDQRLSELKSILSFEEDQLERRSALRASLHDYDLSVRDPFVERLIDAVDEGAEGHKELTRRLRDLVRAFEADALQSTILSGELQEDIRRIQTFPLASVLDTLPRAVRNMAREVGRDAELEVQGGEIELDKKVLEALKDPLYHLLRNAVDHGVEPAAERAASGKAPSATLRLKAEHRGDSIAITLSDDGPGVDLDAVRQRGLERGLLNERSAAQASEQQLLELLFSPGFTTRRKVGVLSGRGVGLDAVRASIEELHGSISVQSRRGHGTTVTITLPLTIYVVHALIVRVGSYELAVPISSVHRIMRVHPSEVLDVEQSTAVLVDGRPVALIPLATLLGVEEDRRRESERMGVVVVGVGDQRCAIAVDEIVGDQTVLAKNLEPPLIRIPNVAGATIRGDGSVLLTLNPIDLLRRASSLGPNRAAALAADSARRAAPRVLLVDDSFTTRALERSVLEAAGFSVVAVADAEAALVELDADSFDAVVSDVSMPGMNGFDLCAKIRKTEQTRALPVILVTSLGSDADRRRGLEAGADAYVAKQEFDHELLVQKLNELLGRAG
ncbi:MAG: response regulator [Polyangiaceae bacterium]|nr:response regulator [Polyangiaceae bacterium]MCE7889848.1 hybrid sensor histidine kinase/response regulator [Sorangiineae bacterium PRO1]MCL4753407.1 response regulator [Myxococcales bacterium]